MTSYKKGNQYFEFEWILKATEIKIRDNFTCQVCGNKRFLNVHHILYIKGRKLWDYPNWYLITLCAFCHGQEHVYLNLIDKDQYKEQLLSGMLAIDIHNKNKELIQMTI